MPDNDWFSHFVSLIDDKGFRDEDLWDENEEEESL